MRVYFPQIISGSFMRTQNSIKENESQYQRSDKVDGMNFFAVFLTIIMIVAVIVEREAYYSG